MSHKDDELKELLKPLRRVSPHDLQMQTWQLAVEREIGFSRSALKTTSRARASQLLALQLLAAMFVGVVLGAALIKSVLPNNTQGSLLAQISDDHATIEHSHTNLD